MKKIGIVTLVFAHLIMAFLKQSLHLKFQAFPCFEKVKPPSETWIFLELRSLGHRFKCPLYLFMAWIFLA